MVIITRWDPFQDLRSAQDEDEMAQVEQMTRMLTRALGQGGQLQGVAASSTTAWAPALDISERKDAYLVTVELPGVELDDLQITLEDGLLTIQGERHFAHDSSEQQFHRVERRYGAFRRSITLPAHVMADGIEATADNGVLQIVVPKVEEAKPKRIQVRQGRRSLRLAVRTHRPVESGRGRSRAGYAPAALQGCGTNRHRSLHRAHPRLRTGWSPRAAVPAG